MDICQLIDLLLKYGLEKGLIKEDDYYYSLNALLDVFKLDDYVINQESKEDLSLDEILSLMLDYAIKENLIENTNECKDLFDTRIMGVLTPKPSEINHTFKKLMKKDPKEATDYFYSLCKDTNYIRTSRIKKDIHFDYESEYGTINISINMSKPEKDPNDIKKLLTAKPSSYPKCMLCKENVNYSGRIGFPARQTLRSVPVTLANEDFYIQYSPYSYYNEHLICFHKDHFNMRVNNQTFNELVDFVRLFPHYFLGSNAGLPVVGGSILNHHHFQGGKATLPMENAKKRLIKTVGDVNVYMLSWAMSVIRLESKDYKQLLNVAYNVLDKFTNYKNEELMIINKDEDGPHNTITPIARVKNGVYELDLVLRNNLITSDRPLGLYHPREQYWHIKKENIGLIEVMGLAILPSRLNKEMKYVKKFLLNQPLTDSEKVDFEKHLSWANMLKENNKINEENVETIINNGIGEVFTKVLKDCAVFKDENLDEFERFILSI